MESRGYFNFERYIAQIQTTLSNGSTYRIWGVKIKRLQFINQTTLRCIYTNTRREYDFHTGTFRFVTYDAPETPAVQCQARFDIATPGKLVITDEKGVSTTVSSIRELHGVLSAPTVPVTP